MKSLVWNVRPVRAPLLSRACPKCGPSLYENSGNFRVNANGARLDAWLIYRCVHCRHTWNLTVFERAPVRAVPADLYGRLTEGDAALALSYGVDAAFLAANRARVQSDTLEVQITGPLPEGPCTLLLRPEMPMDLTVLRALALGLNASQSAVRRLFSAGAFALDGDARKVRLTAQRRVEVREECGVTISPLQSRPFGV